MGHQSAYFLTNTPIPKAKVYLGEVGFTRIVGEERYHTELSIIADAFGNLDKGYPDYGTRVTISSDKNQVDIPLDLLSRLKKLMPDSLVLDFEAEEIEL
jgi:hypothetical protein